MLMWAIKITLVDPEAQQIPKSASLAERRRGRDSQEEASCNWNKTGPQTIHAKAPEFCSCPTTVAETMQCSTGNECSLPFGCGTSRSSRPERKVKAMTRRALLKPLSSHGQCGQARACLLWGPASGALRWGKWASVKPSIRVNGEDRQPPAPQRGVSSLRLMPSFHLLLWDHELPLVTGLTAPQQYCHAEIPLLSLWIISAPSFYLPTPRTYWSWSNMV